MSEANKVLVDRKQLLKALIQVEGMLEEIKQLKKEIREVKHHE